MYVSAEVDANMKKMKEMEKEHAATEERIKRLRKTLASSTNTP